MLTFALSKGRLADKIFEMLKKLELSFEEFNELKKYASKCNVMFISSPLNALVILIESVLSCTNSDNLVYAF